jgi:hypothetical protein
MQLVDPENPHRRPTPRPDQEIFEEDLSECGLDIRDVLKHLVRHAIPL